MDVLLVVSFGGPEGPDDVVPFLENVTRGRGIPRERLVEVGAHYAHFGGVSPINAHQPHAGRARSAPSWPAAASTMPVLWGNRNWDPYLVDALREARDLGATRIFAFLTSAYSSYSGCRQYRENLHDALAEVRAEDPSWSPEVHKLRTYFNHPGFVESMVDATRAGLDGPARGQPAGVHHALDPDRGRRPVRLRRPAPGRRGDDRRGAGPWRRVGPRLPVALRRPAHPVARAGHRRPPRGPGRRPGSPGR